METKRFTRIFTLLLIVLGIGNGRIVAQLNISTGPGWDNLYPASPLVIDENFQGFEFIHSDENPDQGNSNNILDPVTQEVTPGHTTKTVEVPFLGSSSKATYTFEDCAFAPEWSTAYAFGDAGSNDENFNTPNVSNGFVEISRDYPYGTPPFNVRGYFYVDLRKLEFVEGIQYSHSSTGGGKRGFSLEFSLDDGASWDTLRYQPGNAWSDSFTKDPSTLDKTPNGYRCDPSAYGMLWEDGIYTSNVMLRFLEAGGQTPRIHDLKVYGDLPTPVIQFSRNEINISNQESILRFSELVDVNIFSISGVLVKSAEYIDVVSMEELPKGVYIVTARTGTKSVTEKIVNQ